MYPPLSGAEHSAWKQKCNWTETDWKHCSNLQDSCRNYSPEDKISHFPMVKKRSMIFWAVEVFQLQQLTAQPKRVHHTSLTSLHCSALKLSLFLIFIFHLFKRTALWSSWKDSWAMCKYLGSCQKSDSVFASILWNRQGSNAILNRKGEYPEQQVQSIPCIKWGSYSMCVCKLTSAYLHLGKE